MHAALSARGNSGLELAPCTLGECPGKSCLRLGLAAPLAGQLGRASRAVLAGQSEVLKECGLWHLHCLVLSDSCFWLLGSTVSRV